MPSKGGFCQLDLDSGETGQTFAYAFPFFKNTLKIQTEFIQSLQKMFYTALFQ